MEAKLRIVDGARPATIRLKLPLTVGRSKSAQLKVPQSQVSRSHCEIYEETGMLVVHDLGSSNGTFISGERIDEPTFLLPGESLKIGNVLFEADYEAPELDIEETEIEFVMDDDSDEEDVEPEEVVDAETSVADEVASALVADEPAEDVESQSDVLPNVGGEHQPSADPAEIDLEVDYNETQEGSFLGIPDIDVGGEPTEQDSASRIVIDDGAEAQSGEVDPGDSALNHFFDGLGE